MAGSVTMIVFLVSMFLVSLAIGTLAWRIWLNAQQNQRE